PCNFCVTVALTMPRSPARGKRVKQWLVRMSYVNSALRAYEAEECWCPSRTEAQELAEALSVDYPDAQVDILDANAGRIERWAVNIRFADGHESCEFFTLAEAEECAASLLADYGPLSE